jgi:hypothetical protein
VIVVVSVEDTERDDLTIVLLREIIAEYPELAAVFGPQR